MKKLILLVAILCLVLAGCSNEIELYKESHEIVTDQDVVQNISAANIAILNSNFEMYEGTIKGIELKTLIRKLNTYNTADMYPTKLVINDFSNSNITLENGEYSSDGVKNANNYEISLEYAENGIVTGININN